MSGDGRGDDAALVEDEPGDELELVGEDVLAVHDAVAVGVGEDRDGVLADRASAVPARAIRCPATAAVVRHAPAVRILGRFRDPQPAALVPVDVHRLGDQRLGGDERQVELGMHLDLRGGLRRARSVRLRRSAGASPSFVFLDELVDVRALARPRDAAQQDRPVVRAVEVLVEMPGDRDERAVRRAAAARRSARRSTSAAGCRRCRRACRRR